MDIYEEIKTNLLQGEADAVVTLLEKGLALKYPPESLLEQGLVAGINVLADKFKIRDVSIPEALIVARALNIGLDYLDPYLNKDKKYRGVAVIGTVEGDVHDIGKNIVRIYVSTLNLQVIDLGVDVGTEDFIRAVSEYNADILMISALLTTTMKQMRIIIDRLKKEKLRRQLFICVGGLPVTPEYAREIGADYYTRDAIELRNYLDQNLSKILRKNKQQKNKI